MTLVELIEFLQMHQEYGYQDVLIHDEATGDNLPLSRVAKGPKGKDGTHAVVLHAS